MPTLTKDLFHQDHHRLIPEYGIPQSSKRHLTSQISLSVAYHEAPTRAQVHKTDFVEKARERPESQILPNDNVMRKEDGRCVLTETDGVAVYEKHVGPAMAAYQSATHNIEDSVSQFTSEYSVMLDGVRKIDTKTTAKVKYVVMRPDRVWWVTSTQRPPTDSQDPAQPAPGSLPTESQFYPTFKGGKPTPGCQAYCAFEAKKAPILFSLIQDLERMAEQGLTPLRRDGRSARGTANPYNQEFQFSSPAKPALKQPLVYCKGLGIKDVILWDQMAMALFSFPELAEPIKDGATAKDLWNVRVTYMQIKIFWGSTRPLMVAAGCGFLDLARSDMRPLVHTSEPRSDEPVDLQEDEEEDDDIKAEEEVAALARSAIGLKANKRQRSE